MANTALENEQIVGFIEHFSLLTDPRQQVKVEYPLDEILLLVLCAVLAGANCWVEIAKFGDKKLDFLRRFRPFKNGTPSHDQLGDVFSVLDAEQFQNCFISWVSSITDVAMTSLQSMAKHCGVLISRPVAREPFT